MTRCAVIKRIITAKATLSRLAALLAGCVLTAACSQGPQPASIAAAVETASAQLVDPSPTVRQMEQATFTPAEKAPALTSTASATPAISATLTQEPSLTPFVYAFGPAEFPADINPLTGLPVSDANILERRPVVIKVTNFPRSVRPQWGLSLADHIYEYFIGDQMSRFIGVFYGNDANRVGPIRSARLFDWRVMRLYNGIFVFGYADDTVLEFLTQPATKNLLVVERPDNCPPLCRIGPVNGYNNLFADTSQMSAYLKAKRTGDERQDLTGLRFELETPASGNPGPGLAIQYSPISYHRWDYDPASGRYQRFQESEDDTGGEKEYAALVDSLTGAQLSASNIVILLVRHQYFLQSTSTEIIDQVLEEQGAGYALRDGKVYPVSWQAEAPDRLPSLYLPDGRLYPLKPGNVWFEILGQTSTFELAEDGRLDFTFKIP